MAKSKHKRVPKTVLKLPDLEQSKSAVLNSLTSTSSKRSYDHAIRKFIDWYCSEPRDEVGGALISIAVLDDELHRLKNKPLLRNLRSNPEPR